MDIPHVKIEISEDALFEGALKVVGGIKHGWNESSVNCKVIKGGRTNKLVACSKDGEVILVRVYGKKTNLLINRDQEKQTMTLLSTIGCARPIYCSFQNGIAYGFLPGSVLDLKNLFDINIQKLVCREMVKMHSFDIEKAVDRLGVTNLFDLRPCLFNKLYEWMSHIPPHEDIMPQGWSKELICRELEELECHLTSLNSPIVFCHNDLLSGNILYDKETSKIGFVDFDYSFPNFQAYDIANFFCEVAFMERIDYSLYPSEEFQKEWLTEYLKCYKEGGGEGTVEVDPNEVQLLYVQVSKFALASHLFWAIWGIVQAHQSDIDHNYLQSAHFRLVEYQKRKQELLTLKTPSE